MEWTNKCIKRLLLYLECKVSFFADFAIEMMCALILLGSSLSYCRNTLPLKSCSTADLTKSHPSVVVVHLVLLESEVWS